MLIKRWPQNPRFGLTSFSPYFKSVTLCHFEGSRSKSPEDSMEVEGIDDWKIPRNKIAQMTSLVLRDWKSNVSPVLSVHLLPWGGGEKLPSVTHRLHKQCYNFVQWSWRPKSIWQYRDNMSSVFPWLEKKKYLNQFQSLNQAHHGNAAAPDEGPWVQGHRCRQRGV